MRCDGTEDFSSFLEASLFFPLFGRTAAFPFSFDTASFFCFDAAAFERDLPFLVGLGTFPVFLKQAATEKGDGKWDDEEDDTETDGENVEAADEPDEEDE